MNPYVLDVSLQDFQAKVLDASVRVPVLVDFWASWCGPCRTLGPILDKLADEYDGKFIVAKVDTDANQELAGHFGVRSIPSVKLIVNGELVDEFTGALPESQIRAFIEPWLPSSAEPMRAEARAASARGARDEALALLQQAQALDPGNEAVTLHLAELMLDSGALADARQRLDQLTDGRDTARIDALRARLAMAERGGSLGELSALDAAVRADPDNLDARLRWVQALAANQDYARAFAEYLEIVRRDRHFGDDAGRKGMIELFDLLGSNELYHDLVRRYRRELAALLNC